MIWRSPLPWAAAAATLTALTLTLWPEGVTVFVLLIGGVALSIRRRMAVVIAIAALAVCGAVALQLPSHRVSVADGPHRLLVQLTSAPTPLAADAPASGSQRRVRAEARVDQIDGQPRDLTITLLGELPTESRWGDWLTVMAELRPSLPGQPVGLLVSVRSVSHRTPVAGILAVSEGLRERFRDVTGSIPGVGGELVPGLAIGDVSRVDPRLQDALRASSLTHLMAVSGANCMVVVASCWWLLARLGCGRRLRLIGAAASLFGFVVLVTPQSSVLRAAVMAAIALFALGRGRARDGLLALSASVCLLLVANPWLAWNLGFALSVSATLGLLLWVPALNQRLQPVLGTLAPAVSVPLIAELSCTPLLALLNPAVSVWAIPANLLAGWCAPIATGLGLIACLVLPFGHDIGAGIAWLASVPAAVIGHIALAVADLPGGRIGLPAGPLAGVVAGGFSAAVLVLLLSNWPRIRRLSAIGIVTLAALGAGGAWVAPGIRALDRPSDWVIADCPVGQGDAFLIRSGGQVGLIDTGPDPGALRDCLRALNISRLDVLVLTHYDRDHVGGIDAVLGMVGDALVGPVGDAGDERIRSRLEARGARVREGHRGQRGVFGATTYSVLWPDGRIEPGNAASVTISVDLDGVRALFLGDLGADAQRALLRAGAPHDIDVVKVAHHGSADQAPELYRQLNARIGLIGVGPNRYGHPTAALLDLLAQTNTAAVRSDRSGIALVSPVEGGALRLWTEHTERGAQ